MAAEVATARFVEARMQNVMEEWWRGYSISTWTGALFASGPAAVPDGYVALARIRRDARLLADWHLPRYAQRELAAAEAQRDALSYAVRLTASGVFASAEREATVAAREAQSNDVSRSVAV